MNVLVACEYSGIVRDAFENAGHNAWSCDLLPSESEQTKASGKHIEGDIQYVFSDCFMEDAPFYVYINEYNFPEKWDLLIAHPPCTYLSFAYTGKERYSVDRMYKKLDAMRFLLDLWAAPIEHICIENPLGFASKGLLPHTQIIEPYYWGKPFGEAYKKRTCLWLKNLPKLTYGKGEEMFSEQKQFESEMWQVEPTHLYINGTPKRREKFPSICKAFCDPVKEKSRFHKGIAQAMAEQWSNL